MKRAILFAILFVHVLATHSGAADARLGLGPEGEILAWLVVGPFPNPSDKEFKACRGFEKDYLRTESKAGPVEGRRELFGLRWRLTVGDPVKGTDLLAALKDPIVRGSGRPPLAKGGQVRADRPYVAYLYTTLVSRSDAEARLLLGSDDGVKVWVNGDLVFTRHATRGATRDDDQVDIRLRTGANRLLFKVDQHFGGWGLMARIAGKDGTPIPGLLQTLNVLQPVKTDGDRVAVSAVRAVGGKPGVLDLDAAVLYESWRRKTDVWMPWFRTNMVRKDPYDKVLALIAEKVAAAESKSPEELSKTLRDMAGVLAGRYHVEMEMLGKRLQEPEPLLKVSPAKEDYVRVAPGGRYFVHADGSFFTPIGYNHNPDWTDLGAAAVGREWYDLATADRFMKHLRDSGVNLLRMMIETPGGGHLLENPIGTFRAEQIAWIDNLMILARKHGIKLMITPWDTFWMNHHWDSNPYNAKSGGPVQKKVDFLTKREVIEAQKRRWKLIIDRWGNLGEIFAWELLNESDYWWESSPDQVIAWAKEMGDFVRQYEKQKWGRNHLINISTGRPVPEGRWGDLAYGLSGIDFAQTHLYMGAANAPDEPIGPALAEREGVTYALKQIKDNRPYMDGENGPINRWIADEKLDNEVFHNQSWAHLASGGAGSSLRWPYRGPHHLTEGMLQHLSRMSKFAADVPWARLTGDLSEAKPAVPDGWHACSVGTPDACIVWVFSAKPEPGAMFVTWADGPAAVKYRCYDTRTGEWFGRGTATNQGSFTIPLHGTRGSVAVVMEGG